MRYIRSFKRLIHDYKTKIIYVSFLKVDRSIYKYMDLDLRAFCLVPKDAHVQYFIGQSAL